MAFQIGDRVVLLYDRPAEGLLPGMTGTVVENEDSNYPGIDYDNWHNGHELYGETVDSGWWTYAEHLTLLFEDENDDLTTLLSALEDIV